MTYQCSNCKSKGVKLWRQYNTFADCLKLLCLTCAIVNQQKAIDTYNNTNTGSSTMVGDLVPAVPDSLPTGPEWKLNKEVTYWGASSLPASGFRWWQSLP